MAWVTPKGMVITMKMQQCLISGRSVLIRDTASETGAIFYLEINKMLETGVGAWALKV